MEAVLCMHGRDKYVDQVSVSEKEIKKRGKKGTHMVGITLAPHSECKGKGEHEGKMGEVEAMRGDSEGRGRERR